MPEEPRMAGFAVSGRLLFPSPVLASFAVNAAPANIDLPDVTIPNDFLPPGASIQRVIGAVSWRKQVESSAVANAVDGAQNIQVRSDAPGTFRNAIALPDNSLATAAGITEGGLVLFGDQDLSVEVVGPDTYEFQWTLALVDGASLTFHDVQTYLVVEYE